MRTEESKANVDGYLMKAMAEHLLNKEPQTLEEAWEK